MEELLEAIANSTTEEKILLLPQVLEQGESGINYLLECLEDPCLEIRAKAYELLQSVETNKARNAIANGLLLNPDDRIFSVYQSTMRFTDDGYCLYESVGYDENFNHILHPEESFNFIEDSELYAPKRVFCYLDREKAEQKAEAIHRESIKERCVDDFGFEWERNTKLTMRQWFENHLPNNQFNFDDWEDKQKALKYLYLPENIELLSDFWANMIGKFAFVEEEYIQQQVYLRIEKKLSARTYQENIDSELIARPKNYKQDYFRFLAKDFENNQRDIRLFPEFLKCGELGINYLIECLEDSKLDIRSAAYEILQEVKSEKLSKAIASGLLLNPGDIIYSVYESAMYFTDSSYFVIDRIDDSKSFREDIYGKSEPDEEDDLAYRKCTRLFCYVNLEYANRKAEYIHRQECEKNGADFICCWWEKRNLNFDLKHWCLKHKILSEQEWNNLVNKSDWVIEELITKNHNRSLLDELNRSQYIYHPNHIDVWCRDNDVFYDQNASNEDNYSRILDLLALPKNISLLSKFYQDGVGRFAFVRKEIVEQQAYVPVNQPLKDLDLAINLIVRPEKYDICAVNFLLHTLNSEHCTKEQARKARFYLQNIESDYIPF